MLLPDFINFYRGTVFSPCMRMRPRGADSSSALVDASHEYAMTEEQLADRMDGHMDINRVREGAVVIAQLKFQVVGCTSGICMPCKEMGSAGHTTDVSGIVTLQAHVMKGLKIDGTDPFTRCGGLALLSETMDR